jgi:hypothetical protein
MIYQSYLYISPPCVSVHHLLCYVIDSNPQRQIHPHRLVLAYHFVPLSRVFT